MTLMHDSPKMPAGLSDAPRRVSSGRGPLHRPAGNGWRVLCALLALLVLVAGVGCRKKTPDDRLRDIDDLFQKRNIVGAVLKCRDLIRDHPADPAANEARIRLAAYYYQTGDYDRMHEYLEQVYTQMGLKDTRALAAFFQDIQIYREQEKAEDGLKKIAWALEQFPNDSPTTPELQMARADFYLITDTPEKGEELFRELMMTASVDMMRHQSREMLAQYYRDKEQWEKSAAVYADFVAAFPETPIRSELEIARGLALEKAGDPHGNARDLFQRGMDALVKAAEEALDKEDAAARWETIGQYYLLAEKPQEAAALFEKVWKEYPETEIAPRAALRYTDLLVHLKRHDEALEVLEQIQTDNPMSRLGSEAQRRIPFVKNLKTQAESTSPALTFSPPVDDETPDAEDTR